MQKPVEAAKLAPVAVELGAQIALAAAIGLLVAIVLSGAALLLAGAAPG